MIEVNHVLDLGYKPQDASDYENVFRLVPRGDTGPVIYGPDWLAFCLTDVLPDGGGFWRNTLVVQSGTRFIYLTNSPNNKTLIQPTASTPEIDWFWPSGGWALPNGEDAVVIGNGYKSGGGIYGTLIGTYQVTIKNIVTGAELGPLTRCALPTPTGMVWDGNACQVDDKVYL